MIEIAEDNLNRKIIPGIDTNEWFSDGTGLVYGHREWDKEKWKWYFVEVKQEKEND